MGDIERGSIAVQGFSDPEMDFQLIRQMGAASSGGSSVGECLYLAEVIGDNDPAQWVAQFSQQAQWQEKDGLDRLYRNHTISARAQLWKASLSFRAAEYYCTPASSEQGKYGQRSAACFAAAMATTNMHFERHHIPFNNRQLPAYFISPKEDGRCRKTIFIISGFDGTLEEEFLMRGMAGIERDYNVILFAGPGQMDTFRNHPDTAFCANYEEVVSRVFDYFAHRKEIDQRTLCLMGISFGGYFACRAAAVEPRIKRLIANSPILNLHAYTCAFIGMDPAEMPKEEDITIAMLPEIPEEELSKQLASQSAHLMIRFGRRSFRDTFLHLRDYTVDSNALSERSIPCLALLGASEGGEPRQQFEQFVALTKADKFTFTSAQGASTHGQVGNINFANAVVYDWLDEL